MLQDFDKHASEFNFPVLDNANLEYAAARLSAFEHGKDWLITFEVLGFSESEVEFVNDLYGFGSCLERQGLIGQEIPLCSTSTRPLYDLETNNCIADWSRWSVRIGNEEMSFSPTSEEYAQAGIILGDRAPGKGTLSEIEILRFLVYRMGKKHFFMSDTGLLSHFPGCKKSRKFIQTYQWEHPDIANGEKPSRNVSIRSLADALSKKNPTLFDEGITNTHWSYWDLPT